MLQPDLTFIVITYNTNHDYFMNCINSILAQTYENIEIIIVDDGSTNATDVIAKEYMGKDDRIKYIYQENQGAAAARNKGIKNSKGKWISFIDSDDWISSSMVEELTPFLASKQDIIVFGHNDCYENKKQVNLYGEHEFINFNKKDFEEMQLAIMKDSNALTKFPMFFGAIWNCVYAKQYLVENEILFSSKLRRAQDAIFNLYAIEKAEKISYLRKVFYNYRIHPSSICHSYNDNIAIYESLLKELKLFYTKFHNNKRYKKAYYKFGSIYIIEILKLNFFHKDNPDNKKNRNKKIELRMRESDMLDIVSNISFKDNSIKIYFLVLLLKMKFYVLLDLIFKIYYLNKVSKSEIGSQSNNSLIM